MQHYKVRDMLKETDWDRFHALLDDSRQTVKTLHAWLIARGYSVCRNSVWNYRRAVRNNVLADLNKSLAGCSDGAARKRIINILPRLCGRDLAYLAALAELMGMASASANGLDNRERPQSGLERQGGRSARSPRSRRGLSMGV